MLIPLAIAAALAQTGSGADIVAADKAWATAITKQDFAALERLLSDDLNYIHSTGVIDTKRSYIDSMKTGNQKYISAVHVDPKVKIYGATAVLTSGLHVESTTKGVASSNKLRLIHVWVKQGGRWQLVAHQTSRLPN